MPSKSFVLAALAWVAIGLSPEARAETSPWPLQVEMRVPFEPTAFPSAGRTYLTYELYLTNFSGNPLGLQRIEVLDANAAIPRPIAVFEGAELNALLQPIGVQASAQGEDSRQLAPGRSLVAFMWVVFEPGAHVPSKLRQRIITADASVEGAAIETHKTVLKVLHSPVRGSNWLASDAPSNDADNHHRRGIVIFNGQPLISRRYAIDWMQVEKGASFSGDERDKHSYHAYGKPVLAVADAIVVFAKDGLPDNVPGHNTPGREGFHPAVAITPATVGGNAITLSLGQGQFAYYFHLQPGSVRVKAGDRVRSGQVLALIGNSGDAREPHVHFEVAASSKALAGEGIPYLIDHFRVRSGDGWESRAREMPLKDMVIDFGQ